MFYNLASNEARAGHPEAALAWFRKSLAWKEVNLGPDPIETANARSGIAQSRACSIFIDRPRRSRC